MPLWFSLFSALLKIIAAAFRKFFDDDGTFLASGLAFGLLFYSVPFTLLMVSALSYTALQSDTAVAWIRRISQPHSPFEQRTSATFLFQISKWAFGIYLQYAQTTTAIYGALSALVFFLLWLYDACTIFIFSAEIGWAFDARKQT